MLLPSEESGMLQQLRAHRVPIEKIEPNPRKIINIQRKIEAYLAQDHELKESASRAYVSYLKSTYLLKNKAVFDVFALDLHSFATSLGLAVPPRARFLERQIKLKAEKSKSKNDLQEKDLSHPQTPTEEKPNLSSKENHENMKLDSMLDSSDDEDDMLTIKRKNHDMPEHKEEVSDTIPEEKETTKAKGPLTKAALAKKVLKKGIVANLVTKFDEDGDAVENVNSQKISQEGREYDEQADENAKGGINLEEAARILKAEDRYDIQIEREKIRMRKREEKRKAKDVKKKKEQESDDEQSDGESVSEDEDEPDLDWLPDPDEIYGPEKKDEESTAKDSKENLVENETKG